MKGSKDYKDLVDALMQAVREEVQRSTQSVSRWRVVRGGSDLTLEELDGEGQLHIDDDDFEVSDWVRKFDADHTLAADDIVLVHHDGETHTAMDVLSDRTF